MLDADIVCGQESRFRQQKVATSMSAHHTLITRHGGSTRCRHTSGSIQRTSPSTPTTAQAPGLEVGQAQMRNSATVGCLAILLGAPSQRAREANHRVQDQECRTQKRMFSLVVCCCWHAEFGVPALHDWSGSDPFRGGLRRWRTKRFHRRLPLWP